MNAFASPLPPTGAQPSNSPEERAKEYPILFARHGLMAPGIRLFRVLGFQAKSVWVSAAFLLPILLLSFSLWQAASVNIAFSAKERLGVEYVRSLMPLLDAAQNRRRSATAKAADLDAAQHQVATAFQAVKALQEKHAAALGTQASFSRMATAHQALAAQPLADSGPATFAAHTAFVDTVRALLADVTDQSNLTLDPEATTYYLMLASLVYQPDLVEAIGKVRGMGNAVLKSGSMSLAQRDLIASNLAFAMAFQGKLADALKRALDSDRSLSAETNVQKAADASAAFLQQVRDQLLAETVQGDAAAFVKQANEAIALHYASMGRTLDALDKRVEQRVLGLQRELWGALAIAGAGIAVAVYLLIAFYRVTQGGIGEVARQLTEISQGNLSLRPRPWGRDEVASLMNTLAVTLEALRRVVSQVRASAGEIHVASGEVASASADLSQRTEESASQLQRTSAAMSQIHGTLKQTSETASGAATLVSRNAEVAGDGGRIIGEVVHTMGGIRDSSSRIADIIGTIDSIAFQTNILALNAAVEAARAGESGRGFAVVASEVRSLAQRSATAAQEIKTLIQQSVERVEGGSRIVEQAGGTMKEIVDNAQRINTLMSELRHASGEQTQGVHEVSSSVEQLDAMTQQNAALVEQTAAAAATLRDGAAKLNAEMAYFRV